MCSTLKEFEGLVLIGSPNSIGNKSEFILARISYLSVPYVTYTLLATGASNHPEYLLFTDEDGRGGGGVETNLAVWEI